MNENENSVNIDYDALLKMMVDKVITDFMSALMPDEKTRKTIIGMFGVHRKYGIDAVTSMKILQELAELTKEEE